MIADTQKVFIRNEHGFERLIRKPIFWLIFTFLAFSYPIVRSVYRKLPPPLPVYSTVPEFQLQTEFGRSFGSKDLKNKVYLASFFYTQCPTSCASQMAKLRTIQKRVRGLGQNIALLSITVDPAIDNKEVLYRYSRELRSNPHVWKFLTGEAGDIRRLLTQGFKVPMGEPVNLSEVELGEAGKDLYTIEHSEKLVLVDGEGRIRGYYETSDNDINKMMIDIGLLINREYQENEI